MNVFMCCVVKAIMTYSNPDESERKHCAYIINEVTKMEN